MRRVRWPPLGASPSPASGQLRAHDPVAPLRGGSEEGCSANYSITQRELRNDSGEIMRALDAGDRFIVTRNGVPVAELRPIQRRRFVSTERLLRTATTLAPVESERFFADLERHLDSRLRHG